MGVAFYKTYYHAPIEIMILEIFPTDEIVFLQKYYQYSIVFGGFSHESDKFGTHNIGMNFGLKRNSFRLKNEVQFEYRCTFQPSIFLFQFEMKLQLFNFTPPYLRNLAPISLKSSARILEIICTVEIQYKITSICGGIGTVIILMPPIPRL